jgi:hypothetical protein
MEDMNMTAERVVDLTMDELKTMIAQVVDERLGQGEPLENVVKKRSLQEIMDSVDRHRWTPPSGSPTGSEMIREERQKWQMPI